MGEYTKMEEIKIKKSYIEKLEKINILGDGNSFLSNSGEYKSIVSSLILDYSKDLSKFSGKIREDVVRNIREAIIGKIPIYISLNGTIQYQTFAGEKESEEEIILTIDSVFSLNISSTVVTINTKTLEISGITKEINLLKEFETLKNMIQRLTEKFEEKNDNL